MVGKETYVKATNQGQHDSNQKDKSSGLRFSLLGANFLSNNEDNTGKSNQLEASDVELISSNMVTVDSGKTSQDLNILTKENPFNIGTSAQNPSIRAQFLGNAKQWQTIRKVSNIPSKSILKDKSNEMVTESHTNKILVIQPGKENTPLIFKAHKEVNQTLSLAALDKTNLPSPHIVTSISHVSPTPNPNHTLDSPGENHLCRIPDDGTIHGHSRPPGTQDGGGDTLMGGTDAGEPRVDDNSETAN